jgi:hypothetical protein
MDPAKLPNFATDDTAVQHWYQGKAYYDFAKPIYKKKLKEIIDKNTADPTTLTTTEKKLLDTQKPLVDAFTRIVWKNTLNVAFGIRDKWIVARYCLAMPN